MLAAAEKEEAAAAVKANLTASQVTVGCCTRLAAQAQVTVGG